LVALSELSVDAFGRAMSKRREARRGEGTAWLVADRLTDDFYCYWYTGTNDGQLVEQAGPWSANDAVAWGRDRSPRVRIRTRDGQTEWAGTAPRPATFTASWGQG
jgi:hypothetical protein